MGRRGVKRHLMTETVQKTKALMSAAIEIWVRERINNGLIARDVLAACTKLFAEQKTVAMTNSICVAAFRQHGHPELDR